MREGEGGAPAGDFGRPGTPDGSRKEGRGGGALRDRGGAASELAPGGGRWLRRDHVPRGTDRTIRAPVAGSPRRIRLANPETGAPARTGHTLHGARLSSRGRTQSSGRPRSPCQAVVHGVERRHGFARNCHREPRLQASGGTMARACQVDGQLHGVVAGGSDAACSGRDRSRLAGPATAEKPPLLRRPGSIMSVARPPACRRGAQLLAPAACTR